MGQLQSCLRPQVAEATYLKDSSTHSSKQLNAVNAATTAAAADTRAPAKPQQSPKSADISATSIKAATTTATPSTGVAVTAQSAGGTAAAQAEDATAAAAVPAKFEPQNPKPGPLGSPEEPWLPHNPHFSGPPRPPCEEERLEVAEQISQLLDAAPKKELENILQLVCSIFGVSNALIALFGDRRIYILNTIGGFKAGDFPWRWSFCGWTMASEQHSVMVINDALQDARFHDNKYVQDIGVRFYCGAPLVSSTGHRLGTLCFADIEPRVFDTSSLQILVNFSELVTRELEKDIALAKQQLAQAANTKAERAQQYKLLLRTLDCVTSAVLLVDTSKPDWPVVHANSGWQRLQQQCSSRSSMSYSSSSATSYSNSRYPNGGRSRHEGEWGSVVSCSTADDNSSTDTAAAAAGPAAADKTAAAAAAAGGFCCGIPPETLKPIGEEDSSLTEANLTANAKAAAGSASDILGKSIWSVVDPHVLSQLGSSSSTAVVSGSSVGSSGWCPGDQIIEQVKGRQSFTLRGVKLGGNFGGAAAQLSFRCAGFSTLEGAVSVCLPAFAPDRSELTAAAATLSEHSTVPVKASSAVAGDSLYFVTIKLHAPARSGSSSGSSLGVSSIGSSSSMWTTQHNTSSNSNQGIGFTTSRLSVDACLYPQFDAETSHGISNDALTSALGFGSGGDNSSIDKTPKAPGSSSSSSSNNSVAGLVVISSVSGSGADLAAAAADKQASNLGTSSSSNADQVTMTLQSSGSTASGSLSSVCAGLVCKRIAGLTLGGQIAAGSYGRVFRGDYFGSKVAVKVLDGHAVLRRDEATGFCLEALLSEQLKHPNIVRTLAWAVVTGEGKLPARQKLWGETLDPDKPTVSQNAAMAAATGAPAAAAAAAATTKPQQHRESHYDKLLQLNTPSYHDSGSSNSSNASKEQLALLDSLDLDEQHHDDITAGQTWMVLEYCDKGCLQDAVERGWLREERSCVNGAINLLAVLATAAEIASGMALLHSQGIIHGDLSAFNVMLSSADAGASIGGRGFVAKVADFGLSRTLTHGSKVITKTYGTITHMPPETLEHGVASKAADVYSFGVLLWQMVTGSRAWAGMSHMAVVNAVCCQKLQLQFPEDAPEALVMLGKACMAFDPAERPTFQDVLDILEPLNNILLGTVSSSAAGVKAIGAAGDSTAVGDL